MRFHKNAAWQVTFQAEMQHKSQQEKVGVSSAAEGGALCPLTCACFRRNATHEWQLDPGCKRGLLLSRGPGRAGLLEGKEGQSTNHNPWWAQPEQQLPPGGFRQRLSQDSEVIVINWRNCRHLSLSVKQTHMLQVH